MQNQPTPPERKSTHDYLAGAEVVRLSRLNRKKDKQVEQLISVMVWMTYAELVAVGIFLYAAGLI